MVGGSLERQKQQVHEIDLLQEWRVRLKRSASGELLAIEWCPLSFENREDYSRVSEIDDADLRIALRQVLQRATRAELKIICSDLLGPVKSEDILGKAKQHIILEIISHYERRQATNKLVAYLNKHYSDYMFDFLNKV